MPDNMSEAINILVEGFVVVFIVMGAIAGGMWAMGYAFQALAKRAAAKKSATPAEPAATK